MESHPKCLQAEVRRASSDPAISLNVRLTERGFIPRISYGSYDRYDRFIPQVSWPPHAGIVVDFGLSGSVT